MDGCVAVQQFPGGPVDVIDATGAAACPRPMGGSPPVTGAAAAPMPRIRRQAVPAATFPQRRAAQIAGPSSSRRAVSHRERSPSRARLRRVAAARRRPLTLIFPGKISAAIRRTGEDQQASLAVKRSIDTLTEAPTRHGLLVIAMLGSMETPEHERREIEEYLRSQSGPDFEVEHVEKLTSEYVLGREYSVWDAHTNEGRWWVITNPTNLYSQNLIKSMDIALSFHVGLMTRMMGSDSRNLMNRDRRVRELMRRLDVASESLDRAKEVEDFQAVGMRLRELLLTLTFKLSELETRPSNDRADALKKAGDFKGLANIYADSIAGGKSSQYLRSLLKATSAKTWEYVSWLTHAVMLTSRMLVLPCQPPRRLSKYFLGHLFGCREESWNAVRCARRTGSSLSGTGWRILAQTVRSLRLYVSSGCAADRRSRSGESRGERGSRRRLYRSRGFRYIPNPEPSTIHHRGCKKQNGRRRRK